MKTRKIIALVFILLGFINIIVAQSNTQTDLVNIGTQSWKSRNLDVATYSDGTPIPQVTDPAEWTNLTTGAWCYYNNDPTNGPIYGKLYNGYAVKGIYDEASKTDVSKRKQLAPAGWHVPSDSEWTNLINYFGEEIVAVEKLKEKGGAHWTLSNTNEDYTNESGFTALPGGLRFDIDQLSYYFGIGWESYWHSSSDNKAIVLGEQRISLINKGNFTMGDAERLYLINNLGLSVRLINDTPITVPVVNESTLVSAITRTTAIIDGNIVSDGTGTIKERGIVWSTTMNPTIALSDKITNDSGIGSFSSTLTELSPLTTYYVRVYATNSAGTSYGPEVSFTTIEFPTVTTNTTSSITTSSAISGGTITSDGGDTIIARGIVWSASSNPTIDLSTKTTDTSEKYSFANTIPGLNPETIYYVRAYATNSLGTVYGNEVSFTTTVIPFYLPSVTIGTQTWTTKNLDVSTYSDGTIIPQVTDIIEWENLKTGAWCYHNNDPANGAIYGKLYNWYAVAGIWNEASKTDATQRKKLAPGGWHVPSDNEWNILSDYLGGVDVAGNKMKEIGSAHWKVSEEFYPDPSYPAPTNESATNESGFTALPGGIRLWSSYDNDVDLGYSAYWWTSTLGLCTFCSDENEKGALWTSVNIEGYYHTENTPGLDFGLSVRCVKRTPTPNASAQTFCGSATVANLVATGTDLKWYTTAIGGTALASDVALASGTYYASQTLYTIESDRTAVEVNINDPQITASANNVFSGTAVALTTNFGAALNSTSTLIDEFYLSFTGPSSHTISSLPSGDYDIEVGGTFCYGSCWVGNTVDAAFSFNGIINAFDGAFSINEYCPQDTSGCQYPRPVPDTYNSNHTYNFPYHSQGNDLTIYGLADECCWWDNIAGLNFKLYKKETPVQILWSTGETTASINPSPTATTTYWCDVTTNGVTCRKEITITVNNCSTPAPTASSQSFCTSSIVANLVATGTDLKWYATETGEIALASDIELVSGNYYVSQTINGCESTRVAVSVAVNVLAAPIAAAQTFYSLATVANLVAIGTNIKWYTTPTGGTPLAPTTVLVTGTYYASQTIASCESTRTTILPMVTVQGSTPTTQTFFGAATIADFVSTGTVVKWYASSSTGTVLSDATVLVSGTTYYKTETVNGIESPRTAVLVTIYATLPPTASAQIFCSGTTVASLVASGTDLKWYTTATGGAVLASTTPLTTGTYYVSQTLSGSESPRTAVPVTGNSLQITPSATTVSSGTSVNLTVNGVNSLLNVSPTWELLISSSNYNGSNLNFSETGYNRNENLVYSINGNNSTIFNLNTNTVNTTALSNVGSAGPFTYDYTNNRLIYGRSGRDNLYAIPANGGNVTQFGSGSFDSESYGGRYFWNPTNQKTGLFGGYGFYAVKNWIWENNGDWTNPYVNSSNCNATTPAKRNGQFALGAPNSNKLYLFSGQGSCDGNQFASSCSLGSPWATDVGVYCWLKDLWELDLQTYTFKNILPVNSTSITKEGNFVYDYIANTFYIIGGYIPSATYNSNIGNIIDFETSILRYRVGVDSGFLPFDVLGTPPPSVKLNNLGANGTYYDATNNQIVWIRKDGVWGIKLTGISQVTYRWSTGETTASINPTPTETTTYWCDVTTNSVTCRKEITITVGSLGIEDNTIDLKIKVYPNPTSQLLYVSHPEQKNFSIRITDLSGKQMYSGAMTTATPLDMSKYLQGMYLVTVTNKGTNQKNTYKILKK